jgi:hypothetical protein
MLPSCRTVQSRVLRIVPTFFLSLPGCYCVLETEGGVSGCHSESAAQR